MPEEKIDPITFSVIKARVDGIINEMTEVLLRTSRNPILYGGKDFTCGMFSYGARLLTMANSIPVHIYGLRNSIRAVALFFGDDIHPGDCFVNNSPYHGANHYGDWSMCTPVFHEGELVAWAGSLCHLIDCGAHVPTNLDPYAKDIYEEGLHFPPTRLVREYKEIPDLINFIKANFRYPDQWHGDFLAQVGSLRKGEQEIARLCKKYGNKVMKQFQDELIEYGDRLMSEEIKKLPKGTWSIEDTFEPIEDLAPQGLRLAATLTIKPEEGIIHYDLTGMDEQRPWGYNCSRSTAEGACIFGTLACLDPTLPRNDGVYKHFDIKLREGAVCGIPKWPAATSLATICCSAEVAGMIFRLWEKVESGRGHAAGGEINGPNTVCSGTDPRHNDEPYGHLPFLVMSGGPGTKGCDGWPAWLHDGAMGNQILESVELVELAVPIMVWEIAIETDSGGPGQWRGAVGLSQRVQPRNHTMHGISWATGHTHLPLGVAGGGAGMLADHWIEKRATGEKTKQLKNADIFDVQPDEDWVGTTNGGGGYGDPLDRDPELVRDDARNYFISLEAARDVYAVVLDTEPELYRVDYTATAKLRAQLRKQRLATEISSPQEAL